MSEGLESDSRVGRFAQFGSKGFRLDTRGPENSPWDRSQTSSDLRPVVPGSNLLGSLCAVVDFWVSFQY